MSGLYALVLAAGTGSRFGGRKLLSPWRGGVLLDGALGVALGVPVEGVILVTGADAEDVAVAARALAEARGRLDRLTVVHAADYADGLSASFKTGLGALPSGADGVIVLLGDMPVVPAQVVSQLVQALEAGAIAAAPVRDGQRGNPVALSAALIPSMAILTGDKGARMVLDGLGERLVLVPTEDRGVLIDVDRPGEAPA